MDSIDTHSHLVLEDWFDDVRKDFPQSVPKVMKEDGTKLYSVISSARDLGTTRHVPETITNVKERVRAIGKLKIDTQLIAPIPSLLFFDQSFETAIALSKAQNDGIASVVKDHFDVFAGLCSVPLQNPSESLSELQRAVKQLGLKGVEIPTNINGKNLDDKSLWPFYDECQRLGIPVMVHPINVAGADRLGKYYLSNLLGNPLDTSIAIASIVFGGVLDAFPKLKFFFVHGGGFVPYQRGRLDHGYMMRPEPKENNIRSKPSNYLRLIYVDTIIFYRPALEYLAKTMGASNVVLGSDCPFDMGPRDPVGEVRISKLSSVDKKKILAENARKLFNLS